MSNKNKCCKVCRDAGKPELVFTSHYVKDSRNGVIVCPTLLATVCRYCKQKGHTIKYCSSVKKLVNDPLQVTSQNQQTKVKNLQVNTRVNRFGTLSDDSDNEEISIPGPPVLQRNSAVTPKRWADYDSDSDIEQEI
jgi:hypothetical protein